MREVFFETWSQGGLVLVAIFIAAFWGFFLVLKTYVGLGAGLWRTDLIPRFEEVHALAAQGKNAEALQVARDFPELARYGVALTLENRNLSEPALRHLLAEKLAHRLFTMERHIPLIHALASAAPLLGLLGTVSGLIHTFKAMREYGGGNAQVLAQGISEALIATQTGLLVAILLILFGQRLEGRVTWLKNQVEYGLTLMLNLFDAPQAPTPKERQA
jgi:biopolymer transport protein ExbB